MNKEQQELVYRAYDYYLTYLDYNQIFINSLDIDLFVKSCKKDSEDAKMWGLTVEERELSLKERHQIHTDKVSESCGRPMYVIYDGDESRRNEFYDEHNIPTKLITVTYDDKTIESYE